MSALSSLFYLEGVLIRQQQKINLLPKHVRRILQDGRINVA